MRVSCNPAGHIRGSAQIRLEGQGGVWVLSGDYKRAADPTCEAFEVVRCDTFVSESTFGRWDPTAHVIAEILAKRSACWRNWPDILTAPSSCTV